MNDLYKKLFNEELLVVLKTLLDGFNEEGVFEEGIYKELCCMNCSVRECLYLMAQEYCEYPLLEKLQSVLERISEENVLKFKKYFEKGEIEKYLATLNKIDKIALVEDLDLYRDDLLDDEVKYKEVLINSIMNDQEIGNSDSYDIFVRYHKN